MADLDAKVSAVFPTTEEVSGARLLRPGSRVHDGYVTIQIIPDDDSAFQVDMEAAVNAKSSRDYDSIGSWTEEDDTLVTVVPISEGVLYRFKHISGSACRVLMTG